VVRAAEGFLQIQLGSEAVLSDGDREHSVVGGLRAGTEQLEPWLCRPVAVLVGGADDVAGDRTEHV